MVRAKGRERSTGSRPRKGTQKLGRWPPSGFCSAKTFRDPPLRSLGAGAPRAPTARSAWKGRRENAPQVFAHPGARPTGGAL